MTPEDRLARLEARCSALEARVLELSAAHLLLSQSPECLLTQIYLLQESIARQTLVPLPALKAHYALLLRAPVEKQLAALSDSNPALATALRTLLQAHLGPLPEIEDVS